MLATDNEQQFDSPVERENPAVHGWSEGSSSGWLSEPCKEEGCIHCSAPGEAPLPDNGDSPSSEGTELRKTTKPRTRTSRRSNVDKELRNTTNKSNKKAKA